MTHGYHSRLFDDPDYARASADEIWKAIEQAPKQTEVKRLKVAGVW